MFWLNINANALPPLPPDLSTVIRYGFVLLYSITCRSSFSTTDPKTKEEIWGGRLYNWLKEVQKVKGVDYHQFPIVLVGNKCDLDDKRVIKREEGELFAQKIGVPFYEVSVKTNYNVNEVFYTLITELKKKRLSTLVDEKTTVTPISKKISGLVRNISSSKQKKIKLSVSYNTNTYKLEIEAVSLDEIKNLIARKLDLQVTSIYIWNENTKDFILLNDVNQLKSKAKLKILDEVG